MKNITLLIILLNLSSCSYVFNKIGGNFTHGPQDYEQLSSAAKALIEQSFAGINKERLVDTHFHIAGLGKNNSGIEINSMMKKWWKHPGKFARFNVYMSASGIIDRENADDEFIERVISLNKNMPYRIKSHILAFDRHYNEDGTRNDHHTEFYIPNEYIWKVAKKYPEYFVPVISVHPYRKDALTELESWAKKGARYVKWLPNAMGMDPAHEKTTGFYEIMKRYNMVLLTHAGEEKAVEGEAFQEMANPLKLRKPLDMGVKVIVAHLASRGKCLDYDNENIPVECSKLFWRIFTNKKYQKNLFGETSGMLIHERVGRPIEEVMERPEIQSRLAYGSDYPLPGINFIYRTGLLVEMGYINQSERLLIDEIYGFNPLLFHFVLSRTIRHPKTKERLTPAAFELPIGL